MSLSKPVSCIFILYCKDKLLQKTCGVSENVFCGDVEELARALMKYGGIKCILDIYETEHQHNWSLWTEKNIKECQYVIMVCSPLLFESLTSSGKTDVPMWNGMFFSDSVVNHITAPKFVPVFLNECMPKDLKDWLPIQLHATRVFCLPNLRKISCEFFQEVPPNFDDPKFHDFNSLVRSIRGEHDGVIPWTPCCLIRK